MTSFIWPERQMLFIARAWVILSYSIQSVTFIRHLKAKRSRPKPRPVQVNVHLDAAQHATRTKKYIHCRYRHGTRLLCTVERWANSSQDEYQGRLKRRILSSVVRYFLTRYGCFRCSYGSYASAATDAEASLRLSCTWALRRLNPNNEPNDQRTLQPAV